jgi:hypothetical protein
MNFEPLVTSRRDQRPQQGEKIAVYCLDCSKEGESPVIVYWSTFPREAQEYEKEAEDFGEFFLNEIKSSLAVLESD